MVASKWFSSGPCMELLGLLSLCTCCCSPILYSNLIHFVHAGVAAAVAASVSGSLQGGISSLCSPAPQIQEGKVSKQRLSKELTSLHQEPEPPCAVTQRRGGSDRHSLLIPEPRATTWNRCLCEKGLTPAKPPASSFLPCFFRPQNNNSICAICTEACGFLLSPYTCYWTSSEQKSDSKALQDGRKEVNSEAMCTLLGWVHFSTPIKKEENLGSVLQTLLERHLNLINTTGTSFARLLQSTKLEK